MAEIQRSSRRRVFMVSVFKTHLNSSPFNTHAKANLTHTHTLSFLQTANPRATKHHPSPLMSKEKPGRWLWKRKPEKPFGPVDQKYSKHIKEPVMWWVTLAYWWSEGEWTRSMNPYSPPNSGGTKKRKKLEISRGDYCWGQERCQGREEIKRRSFQKMWAGLMLATIPLFFPSSLSFLHFSPGYIFSLWVKPYQTTSTLPNL